jgi:hypothetical protein
MLESMKKLLLLFALCLPSFAQGTASIQFTQSYTSAGTTCLQSSCIVANGPTLAGGPAGAVAFRLVYYIQPGSGTVSALSVELDGAATSSGSYAALTPAVGGGSGSGSTTNPVTTFPRGQNNLCCDYYPYLEIKVNTLTVASGTPVLIVKVIGYAGTSAAAGSGGGGGGGLTCLNGDVDAGTGSCTSATVVGLESVPFCTGFTPANGQFLQYTTASSPNPCYTATVSTVTGGTCTSGQFVSAVSTAGALTCGTPAGGGTIATTTNALKGDGSGNAVAVSGAGTNCVLVNGSSGTCGGGGSGTGLTVYSGLAGIALSNATIYFPIGGGSLASATEANVNTFQGTGGSVSGFGVDISTALGVTVATPNSAVLTWRKNGSGQAVTCTITNPATTCSDTTHSFTFSAGDTLDIQAVLTGTITATPIWVMNAGISSGSVSSGSFVLIEEHTASNSTALNFTTCITSTYDTYQIQFISLVPASNGDVLVIQLSTNGGSSYDSGSNYSWAFYRCSEVGCAVGGANPDTGIQITAGGGVSSSVTLGGAVGFFNFYSPLNGVFHPRFQGSVAANDGSANPDVINMTGASYLSTTPVNAFRVFAASGNITSGIARCYGLAK